MGLFSDIDRRRLIAMGGIAAASFAPGTAALGANVETFDTRADFANRRFFNPLGFGAVGDGVADDTAAVQKAAYAAQAASGVLFLPAGRAFGITQLILVLNGTAGVTGGGTLKVLPAAKTTCGLALAGKVSGHPTNVSNCVVEGITVDCNHMRAIAIYGQNTTNCKIVRNSIVNCSTSGVGILLRTFIAGGASGRDNIIAFNEVRCDTTGHTHSVIGIQCDAQSDFSPFKGSFDMWMANHVTRVAPYPALNDQIIGNTVVGGYYGIALQSTHFARVMSNHCSMNTRCISAQVACEGLVIQQNVLQDSVSAAVHFAYGSINNRVVSNKVITSRANGEGLLQAYVGSKNNTFSDNDVTVTHGEPQYHAYCAVQSDGCSFINNRLKGAALKAYIGVESAWNGEADQPSSRAFGTGRTENGFAGTGMGGVVISGNTIDATSTVPAIYLGQISDSGVAYGLHDIVVEDNTVTGVKHSPELVAYEMTPGDLTIKSRKGNSFDRGPAAASRLMLAAACATFGGDRAVGSATDGVSLVSQSGNSADPTTLVVLQGHYAYVRTACQASIDRDIVWRLLYGWAPDFYRSENRSGVVDFYGERFIDRSTPAAGTVKAFDSSREIHGTGSDESNATKLNGMVLGGNHGVIGYQVTVPAHGKTKRDVGSIYSDGAHQWVLSFIVSPSELLFVRRYSGTLDDWSIPGIPPSGGVLTQVNGGADANSLSFATPTQIQLVPILRNYALALSLDGKALTAGGSYSGNRFVISEHYSVLNPASQQDSLIAATGTNSPDYTAADIREEFRSFFEYSWNPWGAMTVRATQGISGNFQRRPGAPEDFWGVIQPQRLSALWSDRVDLYIPDISPASGLDFRDRAEITGNRALVQIPASASLNRSDPPSHFCQIGSSGGRVRSGEVYGYSRASGLGVPAVRAASVANLIFFSPAEKQYPVAIDVAAGGGKKGQMLTATAFRAPFLPTDPSLTIPGVIVSMDGHEFCYVTSHRPQASKAVAVPPAFDGRSVRVIKGDAGVTLRSASVSGGRIALDVSGSYGDVVLRIGV